jgi:hypothetical protein
MIIQPLGIDNELAVRSCTIRRLRFSSYVPPAGANPYLLLPLPKPMPASHSALWFLFQESGHLVTARPATVQCFLLLPPALCQTG